MFGTLRLILALVVMIYHSRFNSYPAELGVISVIIFYMLSGYTMGIKFSKYQENMESPVKNFMIDRLLRVLPSYLFVLVLTFGALCFLGESNSIPYKLTWYNFALNFLLIPTNYFMFLKFNLLIPPSYSLALEEQFYLVLPFLLIYKKLANIAIMISSISIVLLMYAVFKGQNITLFGDYLLYRNFITMLPIFF